MRDNGFAAETVVLAGGATRSDLWLQIHADVSNLPLTLTKVPDAPALGSAILAAVDQELSVIWDGNSKNGAGGSGD